FHALCRFRLARRGGANSRWIRTLVSPPRSTILKLGRNNCSLWAHRHCSGLNFNHLFICDELKARPEYVPMSETSNTKLIEMAAEIVSAYVTNNSMPTAELPSLLQSVHSALGKMSNPTVTEAYKVEKLKPAVPIKKSIQDDFIVCLD